MRAIQVTVHGGPEVLKTADLPVPEPGSGEIRIKLEAAGVNYIDIYQRTGLYPLEPPFTPGMEGAGVIDAVGGGVTEVAAGARVAYAMTVGSYAEYAIVPAAAAVVLPAEVSTRVGAAVFLQGLTAHYLATGTVALQAGSTALVHAAAGGVGRLLVQVAKRRGATVFATVSTAAKATMVRALGADHVLDYGDFPAQVADLTGGVGVDVVYDSVGQATFDGSLAALRPRGHLVSYGQSSGPVTGFQPGMLSQHGSLYLTRPSLGDYIADREKLVARSSELFAWIAAGELDVLIHREYPLAAAAAAHQALASRTTTGKLLLIP